MIRIKIEDNKAYLSTPYNADFVKRIRNVSGAKWDPTRIAWRIDAAAVDDARAIMRDVYGEDDQTSGKKEHSTPEKEHSTPEKEHFTPEKEHFTPEKEHFTPEKNFSRSPKTPVKSRLFGLFAPAEKILIYYQ